jgi:putative flippase GtrA
VLLLRASREKMFDSSRRAQTGGAAMRYVGVAACGFSVDFLIYVALVSVSQQVYLGHVLGFVVGGIINVILIRQFVFSDSRFSLVKDIFLTLAANGAMLFLGMVVLWVLVNRFSINPYLSKIATNAVTFCLNYLTRFFFFRKAI